MSYNGSGTFVINSTGQPVVTGTVISSSTFNAFTADIGTGLSTAITKNGQTTTTALIPFAFGISAAVSSSFAAGTVAAPSIYLATDTGTGFYRIGANNNGYSVSGTKLLDLSSALVGVTGALTVSTTLGVTGATTLSSALTYGGVTLANAVTGTGNMVLSASPTVTGTLSAAAITASGGITGNSTGSTGLIVSNSASGGAGIQIINSDTGGLDYRIVSGGSGGGAFPTGSLTIRDATNGANRLVINTGGINGVLGGTTPAAASVTTLAATGAVTNTLSTDAAFGPAVTNANAGTSAQARYTVTNGTSTAVFGILGTGFGTSGQFLAGRGLLLSTGTNMLYSVASGSHIFSSDAGANATGAIVAGATSVTTLTASGKITSTLGNNQLIFDSASATTGYQQMRISNTSGSIILGVENSTGGVAITGDTAYDATIAGASGIAFSANNGSAMQMRLASTGLSITGTLTTSGKATVNAALDVNPAFGLGVYVSPATDANGTASVLRLYGGANQYTNRYAEISCYNNGGSNVNELVFKVGNLGTILEAMKLAYNGAVTIPGTLGVTGAVAIGNTVASAVAVASTHKVTMVIGGVTYYLLASNV